MCDGKCGKEAKEEDQKAQAQETDGQAETQEKEEISFLRERVLFFFFGFWAILGQIVFLRETLVIFFGNEITVGLFYAVWFGGIFAGALLGSRLADSLRDPLSLFLPLLCALILLVPLGVIALRIGRILFDIPLGQLVPFSAMVLLLSCAVLPTGCLVGFIFPIASRAAKIPEAGEAVPGAGVSVGTVYVYESLGSLTSGILHTFFLVTQFAAFPMLFFTAVPSSCVLAVACAEKTKGSTWRFLWAPSLLFLAAAIPVLSGAHDSLERWTVEKRWGTFAGALELLESRDSRYQNIAVARDGGQYSLYLNGFYAESFPDHYGNALLAHFVMSEHPEPARVLVIGSGITGLLGEILLHGPERLEYVELDGALLSLLSRYLPPEAMKALGSPAVRVVLQDGRHFVKEAGSGGPELRYDMVIVNVPEPSNAMLNRYYTRDFFREVSRILAPGGVLVTGLPFTENYIREEVRDYGRSVFQSLGECFAEVVVAPGGRLLFFASDSPGVVTTDAAVLGSRYAARSVESPWFSRYHFAMLLLPERVAFVREALSGPGSVPDNTDTNPVAYYYGLRLWDRFSGGSLSSVLARLENVRLWMVVVFLVLIFLLRIGISRARREGGQKLRSFSSLFSIFTTGTAGMSVSILLMFSFQSSVGYLYGNIGVLVALFMLGLAAGGRCTRKDVYRVGKENIMISLEAIFLLFLLLLALLLPFIMERPGVSPGQVQAAFYTLMFLCGMCAGAEFPLSSSLYVGGTAQVGRGAGMIDALDHGGALLGALLTGVLLLPVAGILSTLLFLAGVKMVGLCFWIYVKVRAKDCGCL